MATKPGFLDVSELSFDGIKTNLKAYLKNRPEFIDYDFEGSNLAVLLDLLSYNTYMNSYYLNMIGSESFLDSAQVKSSVVSHAKELNYIPSSRTSPRAQVTFTINTGTNTPKTVVIPELFTIKATVNNTSMDFTTDSTTVVYQNTDGNYVSAPMYVYEGKIVNEYFTYPNTSKFVLQSPNIDINSIKVIVTNSSTDFSNSVFLMADTLLGLKPTSNVYFVQGYNNDQYEVVFGDGVFGRALSPGNIVNVRYRSTNGELGNKVYAFSSPNQVDNYSISVATIIPAAHGSERESIDSIKFHAPRHFTTQNRAVTKDDYINLIREKYVEIKALNVYGGEDVNPPQYGKAIISMIGNGNNPILPDDLKSDIIDYLKTKSIVTEPVIVDPKFIYAAITADVYYNPSLTSKTQIQLQTNVLNQINQYETDYLSDFGSSIRGSKLSSYIDNSDASIISNDLQLKAIYKITPRRTISDAVVFTFENPIDRTYLYPYNLLETPVVQSSTFVFNNNGNLISNARIVDDGKGNLQVVYASATLPMNILVPYIGTVNYKTGEFNFFINAYDYINSISIFTKFLQNDITVDKNLYLEIDYSNLNINMIPYHQ
jgi:hypothetical protein